MGEGGVMGGWRSDGGGRSDGMGGKDEEGKWWRVMEGRGRSGGQ